MANWCGFPVVIAVVGLLAAAGVFLAAGHAGYLLAVLPYLLLVACPLMMAFHMRRAPHRGRGDSDNSRQHGRTDAP